MNSEEGEEEWITFVGLNVKYKYRHYLHVVV